ncbi:hypothetical protein [Arcobacter arenosus]|jgi:hypothetical protein|uniref:Uncharacterized protein n=1 Tax=Arcobacter arenosus TaxID=2576037 RepID=A0A5R8Y502_9BACT|nr:hypothetical protein [Arcobacter arenosus]TLP40921.1 hypothetical protein FDK22_02560 [Arcobacter arenosus]
MNLILVTKTPIIEKIFTLVCKKLNVVLSVQDSIKVEEKVDFIIIDEEFVDDDFNRLKQHTKKLAAIVSEELPFDKSRDFIIQRPFLPNHLESLLKEQVEFIKEDIKEENKPKKFEFDEEEVISSYVESLADDIADTIEEDNDESIVTIASLNSGGVLDNQELHKITDLLEEKELDFSEVVSKNDWKDINQIIDDALNEVEEYEFNLQENKDQPIKLILNNYNISELKPFLQKFDQGVIDRLSNGEDVDVTLSLRVNK